MIAFVHIIWSNNRDSAARLVHTNGDGLAVIQSDGQRIGDVSHRRTVFIHKAGGVNDVAAFAHGSSGGQYHINLVDGVVDRGGCAIARNFQLLEVTASGFGDLDGLSALVDEHIIGRCRDGYRANGLASLDGNGRTVIQLQRNVSARLIGKRSGVRNLPALVRLGRRSQRHGGGVDRIGDRGNRRCRTRHQAFKIAAGRAGDGGADGAAVDVDVVGRRVHNHAADGLACLDSDHRAIAQGDGHRRLRRVGQGGGVGDLAAFGHSRACRQGDGGGIDRISDGGDRRCRARHQALKVATRSAGNGGADSRTVVVDVVGRRIHDHCARRLSGLDGDHRAIAQGDGHRSLRRVGQGSGVGNLAAFGYVAIGSQGNGGGVDRISNGGDRRRCARYQVLKVTAVCTGDGGADSRTIVVDVVSRCIDHNGARRLARLDGDHRAIAQGDGHRRLRRIGQGGGVGNLPAFGHGLASGQCDGGGVDRISNGGDRRRGARHQVLEVTAGCAGNGGADGRTIVVDVVSRSIDNNAARRFAGLDGDHRAIAQGDGHRRLCRVGQGGGVGDLAAFSHRIARGQRDGGGVDGIGDLRHGRIRVDGQHQIAAAGGTGNADADLARVDVGAVVRGQGHVDGAGQLAGRDGNHRAIGQGDGHVAGGRPGHGSGVGQHAAGFGDGRSCTQGQGRGLQRQA